MKTLEEYIQKAAKNGETRSGIILGIRMTMRGLKELGIEDPSEHYRPVVAILETARCLPDAIELVTGCRLGNRTLKLHDMGKLAATFVSIETRKAVRVAAKKTADLKLLERFPQFNKENALATAYRTLPDSELFEVYIGNVDLAPEELPGSESSRIVCDKCEEEVAFHKYVHEGQQILCRACAGAGYFKPLSS